MTRNRISGLMTLLLAAALLSAGCVAQSEVDKQRALYRKAQEQVRQLASQLEQADAQLAALRESKGEGAQLAQQLNDARSEVQRLRKALSSAKTALADTRAGPGDLSPELVSRLQTLASKNPELMSFDADRKMVRLKSDLTFDLGSTNIKSRAQQSLARLAQVLRTPDAAQFEVRVVGHTDNVPVTNPANKRKFEDNWGLSAFRAKAVMEVLANNGVKQPRMSIAGYGAQQPVVSNPAQGGAEPNRRVEIFLVPPYSAGKAPAAQENESQNAGQPSQPASQNQPGDDSNQSESTPPPSPAPNKGGPSQSNDSTDQSQSSPNQTSPDEQPMRFK